MIGEHLLGGPRRENPALSEHIDAVGKQRQHVDGMRSHNDGYLLLAIEPTQKVQHFRLPSRVQTRCRLVQNKYRRLHRKDTGKADPLLLAKTQLMDRSGGEMLGANLF